MFHHDKLKPYVAPAFPGQAEHVIPPKPDFIDGEPEYKVSEVLGEKRIRGRQLTSSFIGKDMDQRKILGNPKRT